ncbi:hypothetical protein [Oscillatoria acuminata]|nr:hypothetical protein [Oscillatoria acuminata]
MDSPGGDRLKECPGLNSTNPNKEPRSQKMRSRKYSEEKQSIGFFPL